MFVSLMEENGLRWKISGRFVLFMVWSVCGLTSSLCAQQDAGPVALPIFNGGFEEGLDGWRIPGDEEISALSTEQAASGVYSLKVRDKSSTQGSNVTATRVPIDGAGVFELRGKYFPVSGSGLGIYVRVLDKDGKVIGSGNSHVRGLGGSDKRWGSFAATIYTDQEAAFLELWIHSYSSAEVEGYLDDLAFVSLGEKGMKPPWEGQYKIKPEEKERLTKADVVGPDGVVYPNWTKCGVQGGIPEVETVVSVRDFGAKADDDADASEALGKACEAAGEMGGGAVLLDEGTYYLDRPVTVRYDNVVIRGRGADKTRLIFRYAIPENGVGFYNPPPGSRVGRNTRIEMHCKPENLMKMTIMIDDVPIGDWDRSTHSGNTFAYTRYGRDAIGKVPDGQHVLKGVALKEWVLA